MLTPLWPYDVMRVGDVCFASAKPKHNKLNLIRRLLAPKQFKATPAAGGGNIRIERIK